MMRFKDPVGKTISGYGKSWHVVGVVKDFNYESLHREIRPLIFHLSDVKQSAGKFGQLTSFHFAQRVFGEVGTLGEALYKFA